MAKENVALHSTIPFYLAFSWECGDEGEATCVKRSMVLLVITFSLYQDRNLPSVSILMLFVPQ
jgi:hypothetical protein